MTEEIEEKPEQKNSDKVDPRISVEVAYALADRQQIIQLDVPENTTAMAAVELSNIVESFPEIDIQNATMGIFSQILGSKGLPGPDEYVMKSRDRVEIYRPLIVDPKEVRKQRAEKARLKRANQK
jgi:hypothetical protein